MGYEGQDFSDIAAGVSPAFVETLYAKFNAGALLRGSMKDQADFFAKALGSGGHYPWMHPEEVRDLSELRARDDLPAPIGGARKEAGDDPARNA